MIKEISCLLLFLMTGCAALKEQTGDYITEAVQEKIINEVDALLARRNLSLDEIRTIVDQDGSEQIDGAEVISLVKELSKDYLLLEGRNLVDGKIAEIQDKLTAQDGELKSKSSEFWTWLIGGLGAIVSGYLGKQVVSAKTDGKRDARIALLERVFQKDLNGDGNIGAALPNVNGNGSQPPVQS